MLYLIIILLYMAEQNSKYINEYIEKRNIKKEEEKNEK